MFWVFDRGKGVAHACCACAAHYPARPTHHFIEHLYGCSRAFAAGVLVTLRPPRPQPARLLPHPSRRRCPVFLTLCHMLACSCMSYCVAASRLVTLQPVTSRRQFYKISLLALIFCLTVVLGNVSLKFIPVSFNQAIGATTPAFTALLAWMVMHQRESPAVYASLVPVVVGVVIASGAEPLFNMGGFIAAVTAASARALKSVLQGVMLSDANERMDSLSLLMYMAPVAVVALIPTTLFFEPDAASLAIELGSNGSEWADGQGARCRAAGDAPQARHGQLRLLAPDRRGVPTAGVAWLLLAAAARIIMSRMSLAGLGGPSTRPVGWRTRHVHPTCPPCPVRCAVFWVLLFLNSFLAYFVNLTNFLVTKHTSALTLQVWRRARRCLPAIGSPPVLPTAAGRRQFAASLPRRAGAVMQQSAGVCPGNVGMRRWRSADLALPPAPLSSPPRRVPLLRCWATPRAWWPWC